MRVLSYWEGETCRIFEATQDSVTSGVDVEACGRSGVEAEPILHDLSESLTLFTRIRMPARGSEVSRWLLLNEDGGLCVDAHSSPRQHFIACDRVHRLSGNAHVVLLELAGREVDANNSRLSAVAARWRMLLSTVSTAADCAQIEAMSRSGRP